MPFIVLYFVTPKSIYVNATTYASRTHTKWATQSSVGSYDEDGQTTNDGEGEGDGGCWALDDGFGGVLVVVVLIVDDTTGHLASSLFLCYTTVSTYKDNTDRNPPKRC